MTWDEKSCHAGCWLGVEWNESNGSSTFTIAPTIWRWDGQNTANTGSRFSETLSPDPSGAGSWSGYPWGTGSGWRKVDTFATRTYTKGAAQTITLKIITDSSFGTYYGSSFVYIGAVTKTFTMSVPAMTYTVSYNANGGSGAPSAQTKTHGTALGLSSVKPTKTGHTFKGWATSSGGSATYCTGTNNATNTSYTSNSSVTLYAVWQANTWTVSFNANGGTGAPANQTKTYGTALSLASLAIPTRTNYVFKGWATSSDAAAAQYCTGTNNASNTSFTTDATTTLYAIWELAYIPPRITNLKCFRCDASGAAADEGTRCYVSFTYAVDTILNSSTNYATVTAKVDNGDSETLVQSSEHKIGTNSYEGILAATGLDVNSTHTVYITLSDVTGGSSYAVTNSAILSQAFFTIDVLAEGHGVAIGKPATEIGLFDVGLDAKFGGDVSIVGDVAFSASKTANTVLAAPNGSAGAPSFRTLVAADLPAVNNLTSFGTYVYSAQLSRTKNTFLAAPATANGIASFRTIAAADLTMTAWTYISGSANASFYVRWCKVANIVHVEVYGSKSMSANTAVSFGTIASGSRPSKEVDSFLYSSSSNNVGVLWADANGVVYGKCLSVTGTAVYGFLSYPVI